MELLGYALRLKYEVLGIPHEFIRGESGDAFVVNLSSRLLPKHFVGMESRAKAAWGVLDELYDVYVKEHKFVDPDGVAYKEALSLILSMSTVPVISSPFAKVIAAYYAGPLATHCLN
jgi:hypothetical protein